MVLSNCSTTSTDGPSSLPFCPRTFRGQGCEFLVCFERHRQASKVPVGASSAGFFVSYTYGHHSALLYYIRQTSEGTVADGVVSNCMGFLSVQLPGPRKERTSAFDANDSFIGWKAWAEQEHPGLGRLC